MDGCLSHGRGRVQAERRRLDECGGDSRVRSNNNVRGHDIEMQ